MRQLTASFCLILLVFLGSAGESFALTIIANGGNCENSAPRERADKDCRRPNDGQGTHTYADGGKYVGEFRDGKPHGQGTYTYADGGKYVGEYRDGKPHGQGTDTWADGDKYVGEYRDGKQHGQGTHAFANGDKYVGEWRYGKYYGQGTYTYANGDKYVGEVMYSKFHGQGAFTFANGDKYAGMFRLHRFPYGYGTYTYADGGEYVGEFRDHKRHGRGTGTSAGGDKYVGEWRYGKKHGQGTYTYADGRVQEGLWGNNNLLSAKKLPLDVPEKTPTVTENPDKLGTAASGMQDSALPPCPNSGVFHNCVSTRTDENGTKYAGEFRDGKPNGRGTYTYANGDKYVGECRNDKRHGQGTYTFADGEKYVGGYKNGKANGQGTLTFADGGKYVGEWRDGKQHGQGTDTYAEGDKYVGEWRDGKWHGQGTFTLANGSNYVGEFRDGKFHGKGTYTFADGGKYVGEWRDGKQHGQGTDTWADGGKYVGAWRDAKKHGQGTYAYPNGNKYVGEYKDDNQHGQGTLTYPNGDKYVGEFRDGKFHGKGTYTFADGRVQEGLWGNNNLLSAKKLPLDVPEKTSAVTENPDKLVTAASGSGFAVSSSGHVITNNHVIHGCSDVKIHHDGNATKARVLAHDPHNDLALLKGNFKPSAVLPLSRDNPQLLQDIYVAGYPFGKKISSSIKVTKGIVSSLTGIGNNVSNIQIDAALQPGNSGGPIIDGNGNVVAVAVAKLDLMTAVENWGVVPENTNFGVKSTVVVNLLQSNNVKLRAPNTKTVSKTTLGKSMSDATYYLSCWMTMAQIEKLRTEKVMFSSFD